MIPKALILFLCGMLLSLVVMAKPKMGKLIFDSNLPEAEEPKPTVVDPPNPKIDKLEKRPETVQETNTAAPASAISPFDKKPTLFVEGSPDSGGQGSKVKCNNGGISFCILIIPSSSTRGEYVSDFGYPRDTEECKKMGHDRYESNQRMWPIEAFYVSLEELDPYLRGVKSYEEDKSDITQIIFKHFSGGLAQIAHRVVNHCIPVYPEDAALH